MITGKERRRFILWEAGTPTAEENSMIIEENSMI
jgi:hypothetical protein